MRGAVADLIARCERATLVYDATRIAANMQRIADAARAAHITPLFAVKSFPHPRVIELAARYFDGFDVASPGELALVPRDKIISIADPTGSTRAPATTDATPIGARTGATPIGARTGATRIGATADATPIGATDPRTIIVCETVEQVRAASDTASGDIAIRVSASITGRDPAVGAILDGTGHRRSRFGLDTRDDIAALRQAAVGDDIAARREGAVREGIAALRESLVHEQRGRERARRRVGLHIHHGPVTAATAERFIATARAAIDLAGFTPDFLDLGGAWHGITDIAAAFAEIRAAFDMPIFVEPGRACADGAGFAVGRVMSRRELDDRLLVVSDLSRVCHLRWSQVELVAKAPHPGTGRKLLVTGATCYEEDVIGEWTVGDIGDRIVLRNVSGYAYAWNTSFGGVPAADVMFVDE